MLHPATRLNATVLRQPSGSNFGELDLHASSLTVGNPENGKIYVQLDPSKGYNIYVYEKSFFLYHSVHTSFLHIYTLWNLLDSCPKHVLATESAPYKAG